MRCRICGREFPSEYYFKAAEICRECFDSMTPEERVTAQRPAGMHRMSTTAFTLDGYQIVVTTANPSPITRLLAEPIFQ